MKVAQDEVTKRLGFKIRSKLTRVDNLPIKLKA